MDAGWHQPQPPPLFGTASNVLGRSLEITTGLGVNFYFAARRFLIVVASHGHGQQIEAQLIMRHYDGFHTRSGPHPRTTEWQR